MDGIRVLITGNLGYIGPVLTNHLRKAYPGGFLAGYDTGYFGSVSTSLEAYSDNQLNIQHFGDIRSVSESVLEGIEAIVHLAAISNDPIGNQFEAITREVNFESTIRLARMAKAKGVRKFIFASSCSVYGAGGDNARTETSEVNPLTAYAKSKIDSENELKKLADDGFQVICLRFATACGMSPRLRLDLVLNDFCASAEVNKRIEIQSDGTPWRPLIHVKDMSRAIHWALGEKRFDFLTVNAGSNEWNYQIRELAFAVKEYLPECEISINENASPDKRSYRVSFDLFKELAPDFQPQMSLEMTVADILTGLKEMKFSETNFRTGFLIRLNLLQRLLNSGKLNKDFYWI